VAWRVDRLVAGGTSRVILAVVGFLALSSLVGAVLSRIASADQGDSFSEGLWRALERLVDVSSLQDDESWAQRVSGLLLVLLGLIVFAILLAILITAFQTVVDRVRDGRTQLPRQCDVTLLGWSDQIMTYLSEVARGSKDIKTVAILSGERRSVMEARIRDELPALRRQGLIVHCRTGDRTVLRDLSIVRVHETPRMILVAEPQDTDDAAVVKTVFAVLGSGVDPAEQVVVAEVCGTDAAASVRSVTNDLVTTVSSNEILSLVLAQSVRDRGMGQVFQQLISYDGCECYGIPVPSQLVGSTFRDAVERSKNAVPIGAVTGSDHAVILPPFDLPLAEGDQLIIVAQSRRDLELNGPGSGDRASSLPDPPAWVDQRILVVGWNRIFGTSAGHLRGFLGSSSHLAVIANRESMSAQELDELRSSKHIDAVSVEPSSAPLLASLDDTLNNSDFDAVAIIPYRDNKLPHASDAESLVVLSVVRQALKDRKEPPRICAELRETRSAQLADLVLPDDLILSDSLTASLMAQVVERPWLDALFADLLDYHGSAVFAHGLDRWSLPSGSDSVTFGEIKSLAAERSEVAIGLRIGKEVELNPACDRIYRRSEVTAVIVVGAGLGWNEGVVSAHVSTLVDEIGRHGEDLETR
jgi:hypothetical protein